jgi:CRISPR-associated endonuclease/helicase Cas3
MRMSATSSGKNGEQLKLEDSDLKDKVIEERFTAEKCLTITPDVDPKKLNDTMAHSAIDLAGNQTLRGKRIVVFVRRPESARAIAERIRKNKGFTDSVEVLTGTMRGLERDELVEKPVLKRFLDGEELPGSNNDPVFLVSTSAGEVGFDLNADHMVCDATTIDSLIQRLGRVSRRGLGNAQIHLFVEAPKKEKDGTPKKLQGLDLAIATTIELLRASMNGSTSIDVSPKNIAKLKQSDAWSKPADGQKQSPYDLACSPTPTTVELTDILLDNWSMTSITGPMPGRPPVDPWLRGIADWEPPRTEVA